MSRFSRLSHVIWCCKYHIVWVPKYHFRILSGPIAQEVYKTIHVYCGRLGCKVIELNVQQDHVHLLVSVPPKVSISTLLGTVKGKTAIQIFRQFPDLKRKPYCGNRFWARGYCVDTVGIDEEIIRKYVKYQEEQEIRQESLPLKKLFNWGYLSSLLRGLLFGPLQGGFPNPPSKKVVV